MAMLIANIETVTSPSDGSVRPVVWVMTYEFKMGDAWIPHLEVLISEDIAKAAMAKHQTLPSMYRNVKYSRRIVWEF